MIDGHKTKYQNSTTEEGPTPTFDESSSSLSWFVRFSSSKRCCFVLFAVNSEPGGSIQVNVTSFKGCQEPYVTHEFIFAAAGMPLLNQSIAPAFDAPLMVDGLFYGLTFNLINYGIASLIVYSSMRNVST